MQRCRHWWRRLFRRRFTITVRGKKIPIRSSLLCRACAEAYANEHATTCATCLDPILPGSPVCAALRGRYPLTHYTTECSPVPGMYVGTWGAGKLEPFTL